MTRSRRRFGRTAASGRPALCMGRGPKRMPRSARSVDAISADRASSADGRWTRPARDSVPRAGIGSPLEHSLNRWQEPRANFARGSFVRDASSYSLFFAAVESAFAFVWRAFRLAVEDLDAVDFAALAD